ncbi:MAG: type II secretion system F family protein [Patescibacteria group bacterium]|jgi:type IV pilus assembly protein PilC
MAFFQYKVQDSSGRIFKGLVETSSEADAKNILENQNYNILFIREAKKRSKILDILPFLERVSPKDLVIFSRQLSILVSANLPLVEALDTLARETKREKIKIIVSRVADSVEGGKKLSEAMAEFPEVFSNFFIKLIETGERVGKLDEVLEYLADEEEKSYDLRAQIRGMLIYPAFIFVVMIGIVIFLMVYVMPKMLNIIRDAKAALPITTRILIAVSDFMQNYIIVLALGIVGLVALFFVYTRSAGGKVKWDKFKLNFPVVGKVIQNISIVRLSNSLSILLQGGVDMVSSLKTVAGVMDNSEYNKLIVKASKEVEDGSFFALTLADSKYIPDMVTEMVRVGEQTGRLENSLSQISSFYTREVKHSVTNLVGLIEPLVIILLGVGVAVVVSAMILPMYQVASGI